MKPSSDGYTHQVLAALRARSPIVLDVSPAIRRDLYRRYIDVSMRNGSLNLFGFAFVVFGVAYSAPLAPRVAVFCAVAAVMLLRVLLARRLGRLLEGHGARRPAVDDGVVQGSPLARAHDLCIVLSGLAWGVMPYALSGLVSTLQLYSLLYASVVYLGMLSVSFLSALPATVVMTAATALPLAAFLAMLGAPETLLLSAATIVFAVAHVVRISASHRTLIQALEAQARNAELVHELRGMQHALERENAALDDSLRDARDVATRDALTGAANRHRLRMVADALEAQVRARGERIGLCMIDADDFKAVNDAYGHAVGDQVLVGIADRLRARIRGADVIARYGGEEFVAVLRDSDRTRAAAVAEAMRAAVAASPLDTAVGALRVTISVGVCEWQSDDLFDNALERADRALYAAKHGGKNRVVVCDAVAQAASSATTARVEPRDAALQRSSEASRYSARTVAERNSM